jgi:hypothetical protein
MPGSYYIIPAGNDQFAPIGREQLQLEVPAEEDPEPLSIAACHTVTVSGKVLDQDDQPAAGVQVRTSVSEKNVTTDAEGRFELPGVPSQGTVQLYALKRPLVALVTLEDCDGKEPQTLTLGEQSAAGGTQLSKGMKAPQLSAETLTGGEEVEWKPAEERDTLVVFGPLWSPATRELLIDSRAWCDEHHAELLVVSTDWSLEQAKREAAAQADVLPKGTDVRFAGPGGLELVPSWKLPSGPSAVLVSSAGKILAVPQDGSLP